MVNMKSLALVMLLITLPYLMELTMAVGPGGECGGKFGGCPSGQCCSKFGFCGRGPQYCGLGMCQAQCMPDMPTNPAQIQAQTEAAQARAQAAAAARAP